MTVHNKTPHVTIGSIFQKWGTDTMWMKYNNIDIISGMSYMLRNRIYLQISHNNEQNHNNALQHKFGTFMNRGS